MTFYTAAGLPDPHGSYEIIDGSLKPRRDILPDGGKISFDIALADSASRRTFHDAKAEPPKSIDEALKLRFAEYAKGLGKTVSEFLAHTPQHKLEEIAAAVATDFVRGKAGQGVSAHFSKDRSMNISDAEYEYRVALARKKHELLHPGTPFTDEMAAAVVGRVAAHGAKVSALNDAAAATEAERTSYEHGARIARKILARDAWKR